MKTIFLFISVLMFGHFAQAQSHSEKSPKGTISLSMKYAAKMLDDYHENAKNKVEDLFTYFQMLTDASLTNDLKEEIIKNIKNCFENRNTEVVDFTSETNDTIKLYSLIDKLLDSDPIIFKVSEALQDDSETASGWNVNYTVTRTKSGVSQNFKVNQLVYLFEQNKAFGSSNKNVTISFLGKMVNQ